MTKVIHIRQRTNAPEEVYIGRGSKYGNPYKIGRGLTRIQAIRLYEEKTLPRLSEDDIAQLIGKTLVCYCAPLACHGDVLVKATDTLEKRYEYENDCDQMQRDQEESDNG